MKEEVSNAISKHGRHGLTMSSIALKAMNQNVLRRATFINLAKHTLDIVRIRTKKFVSRSDPNLNSTIKGLALSKGGGTWLPCCFAGTKNKTTPFYLKRLLEPFSLSKGFTEGQRFYLEKKY